MCDAEKKTWNPRKENDWPVFGFSTNKLDHASESDHWHGKKTAGDIVKSEIQITNHVIFLYLYFCILYLPWKGCVTIVAHERAIISLVVWEDK